MTLQTKSLLEQLEEVVKVDADTYDDEFIAALPLVPHDATSNQIFIHGALIDPRNASIVEGTVREMKGASWEDVYCVCVARIAKKVIPVITGRVYAQVSTLHAQDAEYVVAHARKYAAAYAAEGITPDRFCIKIPMTGAGVQAAKILHAEGIPTLGTALFSVHQAIAAAQAGMHAISMYLNEPAAHSVPGVWPDVPDPSSLEMGKRHLVIRSVYDAMKRDGSVPHMKTASFCVPGDVLVCAALGADHVTVGTAELADLAEFTTVPDYRPGMWHVPFKVQALDSTRQWGPWSPESHSDPKMQELLKAALSQAAPDLTVDYTAPGVLDKWNEEDPVTRARVAAALEMFNAFEVQSEKFISDLQAAF